MKSRLVYSVIGLLLSCGAPALARRSQEQSSSDQGAQHKRVIKVPMRVVYAKLLRTVDPVYPPKAKAEGIQGTVVLRGVIGIDGRAIDLKLVSGPRALAAAAMASVRQWVFEPATFDGTRRPVPWTFHVNFQLNGNRGPASRLKAGSVVTSEKLVHEVAPAYPAEAARKGIHGDVVLRLLVGKNGHVKSLSRVSGNRVLAKAAIAAVRQWVYKPTVIGGRPVDVRVTVTIHFAPRKND